MGGLTRSPQLRVVALVVGSLAGIAMIIVGCTSVTGGSATVNATDAPLYRASVSASAEKSAAASRARESERRESMTDEAVHSACEALASGSVDSIAAVNGFVAAFNAGAPDAPSKAGPAVDSLNRSAEAVAASIREPLAPELRDALNRWVDAARAVADAIAGDIGPDAFNPAVSTLNDVNTSALGLCDAAFR
jgi:hypothetical protein